MPKTNRPIVKPKKSPKPQYAPPDRPVIKPKRKKMKPVYKPKPKPKPPSTPPKSVQKPVRKLRRGTFFCIKCNRKTAHEVIQGFLRCKACQTIYGTLKSVLQAEEEMEKEFLDFAKTGFIKPTLSIVVSVRNRGGVRVGNFLRSLDRQTDKNFELIIVDYGSGDIHQKEFNRLKKAFNFKYIYVNEKGWKGWNRPRALNIGIENASKNFVMTTDIDMIFRGDFVEKLKKKVSSNLFIWGRPKDGWAHFPVKSEKHYEKLYQRLQLMAGLCRGTINCTSRKWFLKVHGYDENMAPYGPSDKDMWYRAQNSGLTMYEFVDSTAIHQSHGESFWCKKYKGSLDKKKKSYVGLIGNRIVKGRKLESKYAFTISLLVSRSGESLKRCLNSLKNKGANEIRAYVDPLRITGRTRKQVIKQLKNAGCKVFLQALTSDSDKKLVEKQKKKAFHILQKSGKYSQKQLKEFKRRLSKRIHASNHPDVIRNIHRCILEGENKWVCRIDDDDELIVDVAEIIEKYGDDDSIGIIYGDGRWGFTDKRRSFTTWKSKRIDNVFQVRNCNSGSALIFNRNAFQSIHHMIHHETWWDFRMIYWLLRGGYRAVYLPRIFSRIHRNRQVDPRRMVHYGKWEEILKSLNKTPLVKRK